MYVYYLSYMLVVRMSAIWGAVQVLAQCGALLYGVSFAQHTQKFIVFI